MTAETQQHEILLISEIIEGKTFREREAGIADKVFTPNAIIVTAHGIRLEGENEWNEFIQKSKESQLANILVSNEVIGTIFIRPDVALVSCIQHIKQKEGDLLKEAGKGSLTFVMVKEQHMWQIAAAQNTLVQKLPFNWKS